MSKFIGVDTSSIDNVNGFFSTQGGGGSIEDFALPQADTGVLMWGGGGAAADPVNFKVGGNNVVSTLLPTKGQLTTLSVSKGNWKFGNYGGAFLTDSGDLYTCWPASTFASSIGRAVTASAPKDEYHLAASNVADFALGWGTFMYVSTSGTFHYSGSATNSGNSGGSNASYGWQQLGTDTDWVSVHADPYQYYNNTVAIAVKGANGGKLYAFGGNGEGKTGQDTTSGSTSTWSLMSDGTKSGTFDVEGWTHIRVCADSPGAIDSTGRLWRWGEGFFGALGTGTNTDILYPQQVGSDTDWEYLGAMRNVMLAIKGGEVWYCGAANYGTPWGYSGTFNKQWQQLTNTGGLWEEIDSTDGEVQLYLWTGKYNGEYVIYGSSPATRGSYNLPGNGQLTSSNGVGGTWMMSLSNLATPVDSNSTINWAYPYAANNLSTGGFLLVSAS